MRRVASVLLLLASSASTALLFASCARRPDHPNVLLITLDTFRAERITKNTPNLLKLAQSGTWYRQCDSAAPLTLPSHATILSGVFPLHHGLRNNGVGTFPQNRETLATIFAKAGYRTGAFVSAFILDHRFGLNRGFEVYDDAIARDPNDETSMEAERRGGLTVDRALAWLANADNRPFFAWVHLYDAHAPYAPPAPYPQTYDGEVQYVDAQVGRLLGAVDRARTIVVVVGDHGESLGEHDELTHGLLVYESTLHVPLIIAVPRQPATGNRQPISTAAVAPMIAKLAGLTINGDDGIYGESEYAKSLGWSGLTSLREGSAKLIRGARAEMFRLPNETTPIPIDRRMLARLTKIEATAVASGGTVDAETRRKLASLGYIAPVNAATSNKDPRDMALLFRRYEEAQRTNAIAPLEQLVAEDPSNPVFRSTLARAYKAAGQFDRALPLYREAVALAPSDPDAWYNLAGCLGETGHAAEAQQAAAEAVRLAPNRAEAHNILGIALIDTGDAAGAEAEFRKAIEIDPRNARSYNNIGNIYRATNQLSEASDAYRRALAIAPNYADALNGLGVIEVQQGNTAEAIRNFDAALKIVPRFYEARLNRAIAMQVGGDRSAAVLELRRLLRDLPRTRGYEPQRKAAERLLAQIRL